MLLIPLSKPTLVGNELQYVAEALTHGHLSGDGEFTRRCQHLLETALGVPKALLTTSCTHALEMCALLLDIQAGDEVIVPSFTFVSTANAFVMRGARPVFCDIRTDTLNLDETKLAGLISDRTKAIVAVHYSGVGCEMEPILAASRSHRISVIEDNAHGLFGRYKGRLLGTIGALAALSFHDTKTFTCGEGGALLISDPRYCDRAEMIREKGTDRSQFLRGRLEKYTWVDLGSSYLPSDVLAACLYAQLEARESVQAKRRQLWEHYYHSLGEWAHSHGVRLPFVPAHCEQAYHGFFLIMATPADRKHLMDHLRQHGIMSAFHFLPLHLSRMGIRFGGQKGACPVAEDLSERLLRLPFYFGLQEADVAAVVAAVRKWPSRFH